MTTTLLLISFNLVYKGRVKQTVGVKNSDMLILLNYELAIGGHCE